MSLEQFSQSLNSQEVNLKRQLSELPADEAGEPALVNNEWIVAALAFEARASVKRRNTAKENERKLKEEVLQSIVRGLKTSSDTEYKDQFNRRVCQKLDWLEENQTIFPEKESKLGFAQRIVVEEIAREISDQVIEKYLFEKIRLQYEKRLQFIISRGIELLGEPEKALKFAGLMFEFEMKETDETWQQRKFEKVIVAGLNSERVNLISVLCCINQYDFIGGFSINPNLDAYRENTKLEPVPLIVEELIDVKQFFERYGVKASLTLYTPDTEYSEVEKFGPITPEISKCLKEYVNNLRSFVLTKDSTVRVFPISDLTGKNPLYAKVKTEVLENVTKCRDIDFTREWNQKFEEDFERDSESQEKRKVFPKTERRKKSLEITRKRWAVIAGEGAVFATLGQNTILVSTERRERDIIYTVNKDARLNFPPVVYVLRAADTWNRKLVGKMIL